jgi:hypothetical protein
MQSSGWMIMGVFAAYQDGGGGVVESGAGGGEADALGEILDAVGGVEVGRDQRRQAERLGDEVRREAAVAEPARGLGAGHVAPVRREVALQYGVDDVVVARVHRRVPEHDHRRRLLLRGLSPATADAAAQGEKECGLQPDGEATAGRRRHCGGGFLLGSVYRLAGGRVCVLLLLRPCPGGGH